MDESARMQLLQQCPIFREFGTSEIHRVSEFATEMEFEAGAQLADAGEHGAHIFVIGEGMVRVPSPGPSHSTLILTAPEAFGVSSLAPPYRYLYSGFADSRCSGLLIPCEQLRALAVADYSLGYRLYREVSSILAQRLEEVHNDIEGHPTGNLLGP